MDAAKGPRDPVPAQNTLPPPDSSSLPRSRDEPSSDADLQSPRGRTWTGPSSVPTTASYYPDTPHSATGTTITSNSHTPQNSDLPDHPHAPGPPAHAGSAPSAAGAAAILAGEPKRPRACEACRGLKVRCEPDVVDPDGPCRRCKKASRSCIVTQRTRTGERQKKTDNRVAELEKKIDALTATLQNRAATVAADEATATTSSDAAASAPPPTTVRDPPSDQYREMHSRGTDNFEPIPASGPALHPGQKRKRTSTDPQSPRAATRNSINLPPPPPGPPSPPLPSQPQSRPQQPQQTNPQSQPQTQNEPFVDIIDQGLITLEQAAALFNRYNRYLAPHLPGIVFPPTFTISQLRSSRPLLFHAIMAVSSSVYQKVQRTLVKDLMRIIAEKVVCTGEKTLELVQAILVATIWYWPPDHFEELKFYQLVHMAAVMGIDIGLGRRVQYKRRNVPYTWQDNPFRKRDGEDPTSLESRRTWLTCYYLATNTSIALHRPNLIRWTPFMAESMTLLETSADAAPSDKYLCHLIRTNKLGEEVGIYFSMEESATQVDLADPRTQYSLRGFERDLEKLRASVPRDQMQSTLRISFDIMSVYMHEMALHGDSQDDPVKPPFHADYIRDGMLNSRVVTSAHINALSACVTAVHGILEAFLSMDIFSARCLPVFNFVRVAYAVVVLIKIYFSSAAPDSELGKVIPKDQIKVEFYLERLLAKFKATAASENSRPAAKFLVILVMLRGWFLKYTAQMKSSQGRQTPGSSESERPPSTSSQTPLPSQEPNPRTGYGFKSATPTPSTSKPQSTTQPTPALIPEYSSLRTPQIEPPQPQMHTQSLPAYHTATTPLHVLSEIATGDPSLMGAGTPHVSWRPPQTPYIYTSTVNELRNPDSETLESRGPIQQNIPVQGTPNSSIPWIDPFGPDAMGVNVPVDFNLVDFAEVPPESFDWEGLTMSLGAGLPNMYDVVTRRGEEGKWFAGVDEQGMYP